MFFAILVSGTCVCVLRVVLVVVAAVVLMSVVTIIVVAVAVLWSSLFLVTLSAYCV